MNNSQYITFLSAAKAFLSTDPTIDTTIAYANSLQINLNIDYTRLHTYKPTNITTDSGANLFLPKEFKHFVCGESTANGSCLYNSASIILQGDESLSLALRAGTVSELMMNAEYYLQLEPFQRDWAWSDVAIRTHFQRDDRYIKAAYYKAEIKAMCSINSYSPLLAIYGLSEYIQHPVYSIFPDIGNNSDLRRIYNQKILPRSQSADIVDIPPLHIMWVNIGVRTAKDFEQWCKGPLPHTNHFVPVFNPPLIENPDLIVTPIPRQQQHLPLSKDSKESPAVDEHNIEQRNYVGALMAGIDPTLRLNTKTGDKCVTYEPAKNTVCLLTREEILQKLVYFDLFQNMYCWRVSSISHTWLINILQKEPSFPAQVAPVISRTRENRKTLTKYFYCAGCVISTKSSGKFNISVKELATEQSYVQLNVIFSKDQCTCTHLIGVTYGQTRGLSRQLLNAEENLPRQMQSKALSGLTPERILTGNRQHVPTAKAAKQLRYSTNPSKEYSIAERFIDAIQKINEKEKADFIAKNGADAARNRLLTGHIQKPLQLDPLAVNLYNEASIQYCHHFAQNNPGLFIDYTGLMIRDVFKLLREKPAEVEERTKKVLNAMLTIPSADSTTDGIAPPVLAAEFITTDLSAEHLTTALHYFRRQEYEMFRSNTVPYLVQSDCARGILRATLAEYNDESPNEYLQRLTMDAIENKESDPRKVIIAWCYAHCT
ncbi:4404_t:CDS:2, partial [Paraglomus occultum]